MLPASFLVGKGAAMSEFYPFAPRESQLEEYREDARRSFSRIGWACFAMMLVMQGGAALLMLGCQLLAMRGSRFMIAFIQSEWFQWVITDAANYGLGLPVLLLILRPMPLPPAPPRRRVTAKQFGALALISYAVVYLTNLIGLGINAAISALRGQQAGEPGGFIVQVMPFIEDEVLNKLEANIQKIQSVTSMLDNGHTPEQMLEQVLEGLNLEITDTMPAQFYCNCSKKRIEKAIISIGKKDIQEMIDEGKEIEVKCHFCNTAYKYSVDELKELLKQAR